MRDLTPQSVLGNQTLRTTMVIFPGGANGKEPACQSWGHGFDPWVGKIPWRRKQQPTRVFLPGKVKLLSRVQLFVTPWTAACQSSLSFTITQSFLKLMSIDSGMPSDHLILWSPLLLPFFPTMRVFSNGLALYIRWPKYWSFSFNISPSNEYSGLFSFKIDCFDLLAVQGNFKS